MATKTKTKPVPAKAKPVTIPKGSLTIRDVATMASVDPVTVSLWRAGTATRDALPSHTVPRGKQHLVYFKPGELKAWAKRYGIALAQ